MRYADHGKAVWGSWDEERGRSLHLRFASALGTQANFVEFFTKWFDQHVEHFHNESRAGDYNIGSLRAEELALCVLCDAVLSEEELLGNFAWCRKCALTSDERTEIRDARLESEKADIIGYYQPRRSYLEAEREAIRTYEGHRPFKARLEEVGIHESRNGVEAEFEAIDLASLLNAIDDEDNPN
jgi:hypothetical protein